MLICAQKVLCLIQNSFRNFIDILRIRMLTLRLSAKPLLAKANTLGVIIDHILLDRLLAPVIYSLAAEVILGIFCEKMLPCNFFDSRVEVGAVV